MKKIIFGFLALVILLKADAMAQAGHGLQLDDGLTHYTVIHGASVANGTFTFPSTSGIILTSSGGVSPVWLLGGNNNPASSNIGSLTTQDFAIETSGSTRALFSNTPSTTIPVLTFTNVTAGTQGLHINGSLDASVGSTLAANPGVWDMVVDGDEVVTGTMKMGGSLWVDGNSLTHSITANKPLNINATNDSITFGTNNTNRMVVAKNGFLGFGTMNPASMLHVVATPPDPTFVNAANFIVPDQYNHVMVVENMASNSKGNGIAIIIHNPSGVLTPNQSNSDGAYNNNQTNYMTFYNDAGTHTNIRGRIEGFSNENYFSLYNSIQAVGGNFFSDAANYNPFNYFTFQMGFDPNFITFNSDFVTLPSLTFCDLSFSLGSLDFGSISFGALGSVDFSFDLGSIDLGSILPCGITSPSISSPFTINGSPITHLTDPFAINYTFINNLIQPLLDLPYKDKVASIVADPMTAAISFGTSFLGGITYESGSGDYAEWLERADHNEKMGIGDVVGVVGGMISKNTEGASQLMVISWKPIVLGNMPEEGKEQFSNKVAFMGQIPVKMRCSVKQGDYIVPSGYSDGFAKAISPKDITADQLDNVLGVSWEDAPDYGVKFVKIAVGLKPHEMVSVIKDHSKRIQNMKSKAAEIDQLAAEFSEIKRQSQLAHHAKHSKKKSRHSKLMSSK